MFIANVYRVMLVSPSDIVEERTIVQAALHEWNAVHGAQRGMIVLPISWDTHTAPEIGAEPQKIINKRLLRDADLLVAVFWNRLGTPTSDYMSGSVEEIEEHLAAGLPAMVYFSDRPTRMSAVEREQYERLMSFKESLKGRGLIETFSDLENFRSKFSRQLQITLNSEWFARRSPDSAAVSTTEVERPESIGKEAQELLKAASSDSHGGIHRIEFAGGVAIQTNQQILNEPGDPRSTAVWTHALDELERRGLIVPGNYERGYFEVTKTGYEIADRMAGTV